MTKKWKRHNDMIKDSVKSTNNNNNNNKPLNNDIETMEKNLLVYLDNVHLMSDQTKIKIASVLRNVFRVELNNRYDF